MELGAEKKQEVLEWGTRTAGMGQGWDWEGPPSQNPPGNSGNSALTVLQDSEKREKEPGI